VNVPADAPVITTQEQFADGYAFNPDDAGTYTNSTSITIFDDLGNPTIATIYFIKTQTASADDPTNKYDTRLVINDTIIDPNLVSAVDDAGAQIFVDRFGNQTTQVPDDNYFLEGKGSPLYKLDDLKKQVDSEPASITGAQAGFDFGEEGDKLVEIVTDPLMFGATREGGKSDSDVFWGKDFLLVNVDDSDAPVSIDLRPGKYNAEQLAAEVERAINEAYGDDKKIQLYQNVDDILTLDFFKLNTTDGTSQPLNKAIEIDLLQDSYVTEYSGIDPEGSSPDFTRAEFLTHVQERINQELDNYAYSFDTTNNFTGNSAELGVENRMFASIKGSAVNHPLGSLPSGEPQAIGFDLKHTVTKLVADQANAIMSVDPNSITVGTTGKNATPATIGITESGTLTAGDVYELELDDGAGNALTVTGAAVGAAPSADDGLKTIMTAFDALSDKKGYSMAIASNKLTITRADGVDFDVALGASSASNTGTLTEDESSTPAVLTTTGVTTTDGVESEKEVQVIPQSLEVVANESYNLSAADITVSYVAATDSDTLDQIIAGLKSHPDYDDTVFTIAKASDGTSIELSYATVGPVTSKASFSRTEGPQLDDVPVDRHLTYSYFGDRPTLQVYDNEAVLGSNAISYDPSQNTLTITLPANVSGDDFKSSTIRLIGEDATSDLNGRELRILETTASGDLRIDTTGLGLPDTISASIKNAGISLFFNPSQDVEAYFEGSEPTVEGVLETFDSKKIVIREIGSSANRRSDTSSNNSVFSISGSNDQPVGSLSTADALGVLGLDDYINGAKTASIGWVDRRNPPVKVSFDEINQRLAFTVDRTVLGTGTSSNFNSFTVYGAADADSTNGIGISTANNASQVLIRGGEVLHTGSFIADGDEIQLNDKRYGVQVAYNSDTKNFTVSSGTTGETIAADGALGVDEAQKASNIQIGRRNLIGTGVIDPSEVIDLNNQIIGGGNNVLMGFDSNSNDYLYTGGTGLASDAAVAVGRAAQSDLTEVFRLNSTNGENVFNVSVNGINGIIEIPAGNYVGTTLATALEQRINQISGPETGEVVGGVKVRYSPADNNFTFTTGTTGSTSTIKVKGTARLGLADVPLGVGSVPKIFNLVQATNADGVALYVDASGNVVTSPPENLVEGYYPLYIDEGELTFDKTGRLVSPRNNVSYEQQAEGFSISLDIDYSASTQFAQPFSVLSVEQDGFTSGRLDGLEIDSSGTIRANYTNGQNTPLGKIVVANFNNQNGLKQIGNATYVETAVSGTPQVGEAGSEGFGNILSGSLERSNVDITEELVNLITAQRNYQASAKAIETTTSLTQTIINIRM
jgi:flagellar hook protein FlgE